MKRHLYKILAGLLIVTSIASMTGCSAKSEGQSTQVGINQNVPMGRYVESNLELPKEIKSIIDLVLAEDGAVDVYGMNDTQIVKYSLIANGKWQQEEVAWLDELVVKGYQLEKVAYGIDGETFIVYLDEAYQVQVGKVKGDGPIEKLDMEWGQEYIYVSNIETLPDGDILIGINNSGVTRFEGKTGKIKTQYDGVGEDFVVTQDKVMLIDVMSNCIVVNDLETGKELETIPYDGVEWESQLLADEEGGIYLVNSKGISHLSPGGSVWEHMIEGNLSSLGMPSLYMKESMIVQDSEFIVAFGSQTEGMNLVKYSYNPEMPTRPTTEVSIYMLEENMTIRQAAAEYQLNNPEVLVNLQIGITEGSSVTKADAVRTLNTELLAGKGPDIILLDELLIDSYIDKGVLVDMGEWAASAIEKGEWLQNIMKPYEKDGSVYALPTSFRVPVMWANKEIIESVRTLEDFANWAKANPDKQVLYSMSPSKLIEIFYGNGVATWLDEEGQIKEEELVRFLEAINTLADLEAEEEEDNRLHELKSIEQLAYKDTELHMQSIGGFMELMHPYSAIMQNGNADFNLMSAKEGNLFEPVGVVGINVNSKHQDIAKDIIQTALSEKVQDIILGEGFAVNTQSFEKESKVNDTLGSMMMTVHGLRPIEYHETNQEVFDRMAGYAKEATIPAITDQVLMQMIIEETKGYFDGEKTASEAAAAAAKRTRAYLAE